VTDDDVSDASGVEDRVRALEAQLARFAVEIGETAMQLRKVEDERDEYRKLVLHLREEVERLRRGLVGQKAERLPKNDAQLSLAILTLAMAGAGGAPEAEAAVEEQLVAAHARRKPVRKPPPADLPKETIEILPPEVEREGLDQFERIGEDRRLVLERRPAATVAVEIVYPKFVRKDRERDEPTRVLVGETVELPIERGTAGPGFLADTIVRRWQDHQPLHRLEQIYAREGLALARSTLCTWHAQLGELARPLIEAMIADAHGEPYLCVDATGVLVQAKERCRSGHFWVMVAPDKHVLFRYSRQHDAKAVDALLGAYAGHLVVDAHVVYDHLYRKGTVIECGCWCHCRRYWWKALASDPDRSRVALAHIAALFRIERTIAGAPRKRREAVRLEKSKPIVEAFFAWCDVEADRVLDESPIADAIRYARNQRVALARFLDDGRLPIHNNISELNLRRQVVGRRNWLFCGSDDGAETNTVFVSLLASCQLHGLEPLAYLRDLLCLLPSWPRHRILDLAPAYWAKTVAADEVQRKLDANVFRRIVRSLK
jgi:transposase